MTTTTKREFVKRRPSRDRFETSLGFTDNTLDVLRYAGVYDRDETLVPNGSFTVTYRRNDNSVTYGFDDVAPITAALNAFIAGAKADTYGEPTRGEKTQARKFAKLLASTIEDAYLREVLAWQRSVDSARALVASKGKTGYVQRLTADSNGRYFELGAFDPESIEREAEAQARKDAGEGNYVPKAYSNWDVRIEPVLAIGEESGEPFVAWSVSADGWSRRDTDPICGSLDRAIETAKELFAARIVQIDERYAEKAEVAKAELIAEGLALVVAEGVTGPAAYADYAVEESAS
jgi:hypothetical protein